MLPQISIEPESSLVDRARSGDEGAFTELVEPLRRPLFAYVTGWSPTALTQKT